MVSSDLTLFQIPKSNCTFALLKSQVSQVSRTLSLKYKFVLSPYFVPCIYFCNRSGLFVIYSSDTFHPCKLGRGYNLEEFIWIFHYMNVIVLLPNKLCLVSELHLLCVLLINTMYAPCGYTSSHHPCVDSY